MKLTQFIMGMPVTVDVADTAVTADILDEVFNYFRYVDDKYSPFKPTSEVSQINAGKIKSPSPEMALILKLAEQTTKETNGYFDVWHDKKLDPSGLVKGWAINNAARILQNHGLKNYFVEAGGDIQTAGPKKWRIGIKNPFKPTEIVKIFTLSGQGIATSGNYERGLHIYNPKTGRAANDVASITVIGPNVYEADRFATAAFAMGKNGLKFIATRPNLAGYQINKNGTAVLTANL